MRGIRCKKYMFILVMLICVFLLRKTTYATTSTLVLSIPENAISLNIVPLEETGTFATSNNISILVNTNNYSGYTLSIHSATNNATLNGPINITSGVNEVLNSIGTISGVTSAGITQSEFSNSSNTQYNGAWGYKPSKRDSVSNTNYLPAPSVSGDILDMTSTPNTNNIANTYTISIGARITPDTPVGAYSNTFIITAVANLINYSITYNANDGNNGEDTTNMPTPNPQIGSVDTSTTTTISISNKTPERNGFNFKGWCTVQVTDDGTCSGVAYQPEDEYTINYTTANNVTLYARWETDPCYNNPSIVYCKIKEEWTAGGSRIQTNDDNTDIGIQAPITTSNSGVFKYDRATFGADSDATKSNGDKDDVYYFRGILDSNLDGTSSTYGSAGDGVTWPNYIVLSTSSNKANLTTTDTCWRIVRTTSSGGVKLIYNGKWTGSTCANAGQNAQLVNSAFNNNSASNGYTTISYYNSHAVGYTYNNAVTGVTTASANTTIAKVFGSNDDYSVNSSDSIAKQYIEKTWFYNNRNFESILEPSAGYCSDRTLYPYNNYDLSDQLSESTEIVPTYSSQSLTKYIFGSYVRNMNPAQSPTLNCPRGTVDLYSSTSANGNGQLTNPVSLLTADEASFAGSGTSDASNGSSSHVNSYLRSGEAFWLLSPNYRSEMGGYSTYLNGGSGVLANISTNTSYGLRPVISLISGTTIASGTGTSTNPWIVNVPYKNIATANTMQEVMACPGTLTTGAVYTIKDTRDNEMYNVAKLADGNCWLLDNLRLGGSSSIPLNSSNTNIPGNYTLPASSNNCSSYTSGCINATNKSSVITHYGNTSGKRGVNYNFCAASGGTYCVSSSTSNAQYDICPKGWRMPTGGPNGEIANLCYVITGQNSCRTDGNMTTLDASNPLTMQYQLGTTLQGHFNNGVYQLNESNWFWASNYQKDNVIMNGAVMSSGNVNASSGGWRNFGFGVRCVVK